MPRHANSSSKPRKRRTNEKLDLEDLIAAPNLGGMLSFLAVPPDEARRRHQLRRAVDLDYASITQDINGNSPTEVEKYIGDIRPTVVQYTKNSTESTALRNNIPSASPSPATSIHLVGSSNEVSQPQAVQTGTHPKRQVLSESGTFRCEPADRPALPIQDSYAQPTTENTIVDNITTVVKRPTAKQRERIFRATLVQHGHSPAEQILYQALWNHGSPLPDGSRRITAGYRELGYMTNLNDKTIKYNLQSLQTKLAIQTIAPENTFTRTGRTYQVFSYDQILQRRTQAGLIWVRKTRGVEFVLPTDTQHENATQNTQDSNRPTVGYSHSGFYYPHHQSLPEEEQPTVVSDSTNSLEVSTTGTGVAGTTEIERSLGIAPSQTTTTAAVPPIDLTKTLSRFFPAIDHSAVETLWNECKNRAPDCTVEEVIYFINQKLPVARNGRIQNPVGFLIAGVPKCFEGVTFQHFRREQARLKEEQRRREEEERRKQQAIEEDLEQYRREEEARSKAEQQLLTLSEEERKRFYDEAKAELLTKGYKAEGWMMEQTLQRAVIRKLAKRIMAEAHSASP